MFRSLAAFPWSVLLSSLLHCQKRDAKSLVIDPFLQQIIVCPPYPTCICASSARKVRPAAGVNDVWIQASPKPAQINLPHYAKESNMVLFYAGTLFAGIHIVLTSIPSHFAERYSFKTLQVWLCHIPTGPGRLTASFVVGKLLNWRFRHNKACGVEISIRVSSYYVIPFAYPLILPTSMCSSLCAPPLFIFLLLLRFGFCRWFERFS